MFLFSDAANDYSDNTSEQVDTVEVQTENKETDELFSVCKNTIMVANHSENDQAKSKSENHSSTHK